MTPSRLDGEDSPRCLSAAHAADMVLIPDNSRPSAADLTAIGASIEVAR